MDNSPSARDQAASLEAEHQRLLLLLEHTRDALSDSATTQEEIVASLQELTNSLQVHFKAEEAEKGFLSEIVAEAPQTAQEAELLRREHNAMRQELQQMQELAGQGGNDWKRILARRFEAFAQRLHAHERHEHWLLMDTISRDVAARD